MKRAVNFRLNQEAIKILLVLNQQLHLSKTEILERALYRYAERKLKTKVGLLKYAGTLDHEQADKMLVDIKQSRVSKDHKRF